MEIIFAISGFLGGGVLSYFMWDKALKSKKRKSLMRLLLKERSSRRIKSSRPKKSFFS